VGADGAEVTLLVALLGCAGSDTTPTGTDPTGASSPSEPHTGAPPACVPTVVIGAGEDQWVDLAPLDEVELVHGPQGGWHVLWSARVGGTEPTVQLRGVITDVASGIVVSDVTYGVGLVPIDGCSGASIGRYGYLDVTPLVEGDLDTPPELLAGHTLLLHVDATDFAGTSASAELQVIAVPDPDDT
jgi:hypothetical protein